MAKITDANIWLGDRYNQKQALVAIPAGPGADDPGILVLESTSAAGAASKAALYLWADSSNNLRYHTSKPTTEDSDGTILGAATVSTATRTLDNLATTTAINSSLISDTDSTDSLGSSSKYWANTYTDKLYMYSTTTYITGGSGLFTFTGAVTLGADGTDTDFIAYGETAGEYLKWDGDAYTNHGMLHLRDNVRLAFGAASATTGDIYIYGDGTNVLVNAAADDVIWEFGSATDVDVHFTSHDNANKDAGWISDIYTFQLATSAILQFGGSALDTVTDGVKISFDNSDTLNIDAVNANDTVRIGETTITDFQLDGTNYDLLWDGSADALRFNDGAEACFGTSQDIYMRYDGTGNTLDIGQTADGTGSIDFIDIQAVFTGADSAGTLLTVAGIDTTGNSDTVAITHKGTGSALKISNATTTNPTALLELVPMAAQTTAALLVDGSTSDWDGANDVGMVHIKSDTNLAHTGATLLYVTSSNSIDDCEGGLARFLDTAAAGGGTAEYAVEISSTNNEALHVSSGNVLIANEIAADSVQLTATARVATADGTGTGTIADNTSFVTVTVTTDANDIIILPTPTPGKVVWLQSGAVAYELRSDTPASVAINGGTGAAAESAVLNTDILTRCVCGTSTTWICTHFAADGTESAADAAA